MDLPADVSYRVAAYEPGRAEAWEAMLSPEERALLQGFRQDRRRRSYTLGRAVARTLLAERLGMPPEDVPLQVAPDGAVDVLGAPHALSITHADDLVCAAVAERPVGVDLERIAPRRPDLHRFLLHPDEYHLLDEWPLDRVRAVILCWVLKEAVLKAQRTGFRCSPKRLRLAVDVAAGAAVVTVDGGATWEARFEEQGPFYLAIAYEG